jgi:hypothetical protein
VLASDTARTTVCAGQALLPAVPPNVLRCTGATGSDLADVSCQLKVSPRPGCNLFLEARLQSDRQGDSWSGTGTWKMRSAGSCTHVERGEDFVLTARRLDRTADCAPALPSLGAVLFSRLAIVPFLEE